MKFVNLGRSGLKVSQICLGMMTYGTPRWRPWVLDEAASRIFVRRAIELGINFFDTANMYSFGESEMVTGKLLKEFARREDVVIATKVYFPVESDVQLGPGGQIAPNSRANQSGLSRKHIMQAIDASLQRLGTDYVDLYQIHRWDYDTPIDETMEALHDIVKAGKTRYIGASSMCTWQFAQAQHVAASNGWTKFVSMQNHYNLVYREEEREMIPYCKATGVGLIPWSPLARGFLAGNRTVDIERGGSTDRAKTDDLAKKFYYTDSDYDIVRRLTDLAQQRSESNARLAYAWLLHKGVTAPIIGASKLFQLEDAVAATETSLSAEECASLEEAYQPHRVLGHS